MKDYAKRFYKSRQWQECRAAYAKSVGGLCEICLKNGTYKPGEIVHHINHITLDNITDPAVLLSWDNLELVCRDCHGQLHRSERRFVVDDLGRVTAV